MPRPQCSQDEASYRFVKKYSLYNISLVYPYQLGTYLISFEYRVLHSRVPCTLAFFTYFLLHFSTESATNSQPGQHTHMHTERDSRTLVSIILIAFALRHLFTPPRTSRSHNENAFCCNFDWVAIFAFYWPKMPKRMFAQACGWCLFWVHGKL